MQMAEDLRLIRTKLGISQERVGSLLGVSRNLICRCESGALVPGRRVQWVRWLSMAIREMDDDRIRRVRIAAGYVERGEMLIPDWWGEVWQIRQEGSATPIG